ncbi:MAG: two-component sensor histidine kinase, partial [Alphaproteobacteria bacterium]|nr:two-component sensor histidine kinase [Alphaproteobacteria bacterium]
MSVDAPPSRSVVRSIGRLFTSRAMAYGLAVLAIVAGALTYAAVTGLLPLHFASTRFVRALFLADVAIVLALAAVVVARLARAVVERRRGVAGARLHLRLVLL